MKLVTPPPTPTINVLLWGAPKTYKTTGACSLARRDPVLLLNSDLPTASRLAHRSYPGLILEPEMPMFDKNNLGQIEVLLSEVCREVLKPQEQRQPGPFGTVCVDTVGELYRRYLEEHSKRVVRPTLNSYGDVGVQVERFCRFLCEVPTINTVLICHEVGTGDGEEREKIPFTSTKAGSETLGNKLASMVDIIAYSGIRVNDDGTKTPMAQLVPAKGRNAGDRFNCLGNTAELNLADWVDQIIAYEAEQGAIVAPIQQGANVGTTNTGGEKPADGGTGKRESLKLEFRNKDQQQTQGATV